MRTTEGVIPHYTQQLQDHVQPDMITLGSLSLQQVSATKRNICVIIPYSLAHQPCPLCRVSLAFSNGYHVHVCVLCGECARVCVCVVVCVCVCVFISEFFYSPFLPDLYRIHTFFLGLDIQIFHITNVLC